jgi:hypothetical protein
MNKLFIPNLLQQILDVVNFHCQSKDNELLDICLHMLRNWINLPGRQVSGQYKQFYQVMFTIQKEPFILPKMKEMT